MLRKIHIKFNMNSEWTMSGFQFLCTYLILGGLLKKAINLSEIKLTTASKKDTRKIIEKTIPDTQSEKIPI